MDKIDWTKPIEQDDDIGCNGAIVLKVNDDGSADVLEQQMDVVTWIAATRPAHTTVLRNKRETITPHGWANITSQNSVIWYPDLEMAKKHSEKDSPILTYEELLSGKFKDGIPKGYISEES